MSTAPIIFHLLPFSHLLNMRLFDSSSSPKLLPGLPSYPSYILSITGDAKDPVDTRTKKLKTKDATASFTGEAKDPEDTKDATASITRCVQQFALHGAIYDILNTKCAEEKRRATAEAADAAASAAAAAVPKVQNFWIVTGGTNQGIMGQCGRYFRQIKSRFESSSHVNLLGIAPTGPLRLKDTVAPLNIDKFPDLSFEDNSDAALIDKFPELSFEDNADATLDANHDFLMLYDNGDHSRHFGTEIQFRRAFELHAARRKNSGKKNASVICMVFGGDICTLNTVLSCTRDKIPVLLINGSGRAAELLSEARMYAIFD
jgi:hypothetical protein